MQKEISHDKLNYFLGFEVKLDFTPCYGKDQTRTEKSQKSTGGNL